MGGACTGKDQFDKSCGVASEDSLGIPSEATVRIIKGCDPCRILVLLYCFSRILVKGIKEKI